MQLEQRPYGPDSTKEEVEAIASRISVYAPGVLMYREAPVMSLFQLDIFERQLTELGDRTGYRLIIDLSQSAPPGAALRKRLKEMFLAQPLIRVAVFTEKNFVINIAAKFVLGSMGLKFWSLHKHFEEALAAVNE